MTYQNHENFSMTYGGESVTVTLGQPQDQICVNGEAIGLQCADGSCDVERCMRIAARHCWGPVYETRESAEIAGYGLSAPITIWDDVEYAIVEST